MVTCTGAGLRAKTSIRLPGGVQGEVDEDVDPVAADPFGELAIAQAHAHAPLVGLRP